MTPDELLAAFPGAEIMTGPDLGTVVCAFCWKPVQRTESGALRLAGECARAGRHVTMRDNALRIEFSLTWNVYWKRVETYGTPAQNPKAWQTPKDKRWR